jgi:tetratricopeptide (TPR) repeat protein
LLQKLGAKKWQAVTLHNIGDVYSDLGDKQEALKFYNQSLPLSIEVGDKSQQAITLNGIGRVYSDLGDNNAEAKNLRTGQDITNYAVKVSTIMEDLAQK